MAVALGMGELQILQVDVVLEIDESLALRPSHRPERLRPARCRVPPWTAPNTRGRIAEPLRRARAVGKAVAEPGDAGGRTGGHEPCHLGRQKGAVRF